MLEEKRSRDISWKLNGSDNESESESDRDSESDSESEGESDSESESDGESASGSESRSESESESDLASATGIEPDSANNDLTTYEDPTHHISQGTCFLHTKPEPQPQPQPQPQASSHKERETNHLARLMGQPRRSAANKPTIEVLPID